MAARQYRRQTSNNRVLQVVAGVGTIARRTWNQGGRSGRLDAFVSNCSLANTPQTVFTDSGNSARIARVVDTGTNESYMGKKITSIDVPDLTLSSCSVGRHCAFLCETKVLPFWWYIGKSRLFGNYSLPFKGKNDNWWYRVKPGLCWAADFFAPISPNAAKPHMTRSFLGYQHIVADEGLANSTFVINAITNLSEYDTSSINAKRRNAVRKGLRCCNLSIETSPDAETLDGCRKAWEDLTHRTGWKGEVDKDWFNESWKLLAGCPGTSIIVGRESESGEVAGFLVTKIIGDTAYVDTIASRSDMLRTNVNDAIVYAFLCNAKKAEGVTKAHYAIRSNVTKLEAFKTGLGFAPLEFPAITHLRGPMPFLMRTFFGEKYKRMTGRFNTEQGDN